MSHSVCTVSLFSAGVSLSLPASLYASCRLSTHSSAAFAAFAASLCRGPRTRRSMLDRVGNNVGCSRIMFRRRRRGWALVFLPGRRLITSLRRRILSLFHLTPPVALLVSSFQSGDEQLMFQLDG